MKAVRMVELFAGIGAQASAMERAGVPCERVAVCEIDGAAYASYCAMHGDTPNLGDITKVEHLPDCDLLTYSFPCQSISLAGKMEGFDKGSGTASSLLWEVQRLLADAKERNALPSALVMENVFAIVNKKNIANFSRWIAWLSSIGYTSKYQCLNAKDFDIPQNRNRCFMVSRLGRLDFEFPKGRPKTRYLKDVLESGVPESYFLSQERLEKLVIHRDRNKAAGRGFGFRVTPVDGIASAVTSRSGREEEETLIHDAVIPVLTPSRSVKKQNGRQFGDDGGDAYTVTAADPNGIAVCPFQIGQDRANVKPKASVLSDEGGDAEQGTAHDGAESIQIVSATQKGYMLAEDGDGCYIAHMRGKRGTVQKGMTPTLKAGTDIGAVQSMRIRRLTPRECWRLMDFTDAEFDRASAATYNGRPMSRSQLYKQAGNSICVGVLAAIFGAMYGGCPVRHTMIDDFTGREAKK